ncbi:MAG: hypothetical protein FJZ58_03035 [Chlamydiae bacterium]|nr:hypothetical protein [Chlamydiota bacterium]
MQIPLYSFHFLEYASYFSIGPSTGNACQLAEPIISQVGLFFAATFESLSASLSCSWSPYASVYGRGGSAACAAPQGFALVISSPVIETIAVIAILALVSFAVYQYS